MLPNSLLSKIMNAQLFRGKRKLQILATSLISRNFPEKNENSPNLVTLHPSKNTCFSAGCAPPSVYVTQTAIP
jgi:hypothetical protein